MMNNLTDRQQEICRFILSFTQEYGYPPTVREIGEHIGGKSPSTVQFHLNRLREGGMITDGGGRTRTVALTEAALSALGCLPEPPKHQIPLLGNVAAGAPILAEECIEEYIAFDAGRHPEEYFALRVRGESMLGAGILPDDLVVVHQQSDAVNGEIVVALFEDEATVKTLSRKNGKVWLLPENPAYAPIDGTYARIIGKVTALIRRY